MLQNFTVMFYCLIVIYLHIIQSKISQKKKKEQKIMNFYIFLKILLFKMNYNHMLLLDYTAISSYFLKAQLHFQPTVDLFSVMNKKILVAGNSQFV